MGFIDKIGVERLWEHIISRLGQKVDKIDGKGLSSNDFTDEYKDKLNNVNFQIDKTLTLENEAAEAKAVGDAIQNLATKSETTTITIPASAWTGIKAPYLAMNQACSIATMTNNLIVSISPILENDEGGLDEILSADTYNAIAKAKLMTIVQANGSITFAAYGKKPEIDIPVVVMEVG